MTAEQSDAPVLFTPDVRAADERADYWLRQVTVRLRREICWIWHERGVLPGECAGSLPPFTDKVQAVLDMSRFRQEKSEFFRSDPTARYLTDLLEAPPPTRAPAAQGSFGWVVDALALDDLASFTLATGLAAAFDSAMGSIVAACLNDSSQLLPNLALVQKLWDEPGRLLALADPSHTLLRHGLLRQDAGKSAVHAEAAWNIPLAVPPLVANQLLFPESPLPPGLVELGGGTEGARGTKARLVAERLTVVDGLRIVPVLGPSGSRHEAVVRALSGGVGRSVAQCTVDAGLVAAEGCLRTQAVICWLRGMDLFLPEDLVAAATHDEHHRMEQVLPPLTLPLAVYVGVSERSQVPRIPSKHLLPLLEVDPFTFADRAAYWKRALGPKAEGRDTLIAEGARRFRYRENTIDAVAAGLKDLPGPLSKREFFAACRAELEVDVGELAQKVTPRFQDEKLILPPKQERQFQEVLRAMDALTEVHYGWGTARVWHEGGITALFAGPPGTGKTMAAEILALRLDLPMYRIDLSQVVNKYIGETEKNLKRLFDAADVSDAVLFFDEADSLFGRRTEVKDAHDRYANLEISYLLERMERFKGLAILATNRKKDLDEAFLRRIRFIIDFPLPDAAQRREIWLQCIPDTVDSSALDVDFLARQFQLAGGHIRSIVFNACLQSANGTGAAGRDGSAARLEMPVVVTAVKREFDKLNRSVSLAQFGPYVPLVSNLDHPNAAY